MMRGAISGVYAENRGSGNELCPGQIRLYTARDRTIWYNAMMKSPFPGMDPYLERHWGDVHSSMITFAKQSLQQQLGADLVARSEERIYVDDDDALRRQHRVPDVRVVEYGISDVPMRPTAGIAIAEPVVIEVLSDEITESFIQILDVANGNRVVTVIEFLSPANKLYKAARKSYKDKQEECLDARTNLVEVDLTRAGKRELLVSEFELPEKKRGEYLVSVYRANIGKHGRREGYGLKFQERLPGIRIPLRSGDADIALDLQSLVNQAYDAGAYGKTLNYNKECDPPIAEEHAAWADELLRSSKCRS
jgi:hypothetical protein